MARLYKFLALLLHLIFLQSTAAIFNLNYLNDLFDLLKKPVYQTTPSPFLQSISVNNSSTSSETETINSQSPIKIDGYKLSDVKHQLQVVKEFNKNVSEKYGDLQTLQKYYQTINKNYLDNLAKMEIVGESKNVRQMKRVRESLIKSMNDTTGISMNNLKNLENGVQIHKLSKSLLEMLSKNFGDNEKEGQNHRKYGEIKENLGHYINKTFEISANNFASLENDVRIYQLSNRLLSSFKKLGELLAKGDAPHFEDDTENSLNLVGEYLKTEAVETTTTTTTITPTTTKMTTADNPPTTQSSFIEIQNTDYYQQKTEQNFNEITAVVDKLEQYFEEPIKINDDPKKDPTNNKNKNINQNQLSEYDQQIIASLQELHDITTKMEGIFDNVQNKANKFHSSVIDQWLVFNPMKSQKYIACEHGGTSDNCKKQLEKMNKNSENKQGRIVAGGVMGNGDFRVGGNIPFYVLSSVIIYSMFF